MCDGTRMRMQIHRQRAPVHGRGASAARFDSALPRAIKPTFGDPSSKLSVLFGGARERPTKPGPLPATPQMCVLCSRKHTQKMYYDMLYRPPAVHTGVIQRYGVLCSVENEYSADYILMMPPHGPVHCMPFPSPVHGRNNYTVQVRSAVRYLVQRPEMGFRLPSLRAALDA